MLEISDYVCELKFKKHFINELFCTKCIKLQTIKIQFTKMILTNTACYIILKFSGFIIHINLHFRV